MANSKRADEVREHVGHPGLSTLRALDIVLCMYGKEHRGRNHVGEVLL